MRSIRVSLILVVRSAALERRPLSNKTTSINHDDTGVSVKQY